MFKKITNFISSMKFGMILLILIIICSLAGSFIPQGYDNSFYEEEYHQLSNTLLLFQLNNVFRSWYFISLMTFLCINLIFCSIIRLKKTVRRSNQGLVIASSVICQPAEPEYTDKVAGFLKAQRFKVYHSEDSTIYYKNTYGYYGSFLVHLSLLLILVFGTCAMYFTTMEDVDIMVGESAVLSDDTKITVESFQIEDEYGEIDYESILQITDKQGNVSEPVAVSVNYPFSFGGHKYYQQTYGFAGYITVVNKNISNPLYMKENGFITLDGQDGIMYYGVYSDYIKNEDGSVSVIKDLGKGYSNPIYNVAIVENNTITEGMALPGTSYKVGDVLYSFNNPVLYPGIRVKTNPAIIMALLYISFALMIVGLWLCFFHVPIYVKIDDTGYVLISPKPSVGLKAKINASIRTCEREENK